MASSHSPVRLCAQSQATAASRTVVPHLNEIGDINKNDNKKNQTVFKNN